MATVNSARSNFRDVVSMVEAGTGRIIALANVQIHIYAPGTVNPVNVYGSRNPADVVPLAQPITTDATGIINFWAEPGEYDIAFHDTIVPARVADQTRGWSALSPIAKGIPSSAIRDDNALPFLAGDPITMRQHVPLGSVIDWWRPSSTYDAGAGPGNPPPGFAICDGSAVTAANHDFGTGGTITLPDLRNRFVLGADITKADGSTLPIGGELDGAASAPGIRGSSGQHRVVLATGEMPPHGHDQSSEGYIGTGSGLSGSANIPTTGSSFGIGQVGQVKNTTSSVGGGGSHSNVPGHVGLLKIMKIRRS